MYIFCTVLHLNIAPQNLFTPKIFCQHFHASLTGNHFTAEYMYRYAVFNIYSKHFLREVRNNMHRTVPVPGTDTVSCSWLAVISVLISGTGTYRSCFRCLYLAFNSYTVIWLSLP